MKSPRAGKPVHEAELIQFIAFQAPIRTEFPFSCLVSLSKFSFALPFRQQFKGPVSASRLKLIIGLAQLANPILTAAILFLFAARSFVGRLNLGPNLSLGWHGLVCKGLPAACNFDHRPKDRLNLISWPMLANADLLPCSLWSAQWKCLDPFQSRCFALDTIQIETMRPTQIISAQTGANGPVRQP